MATEQGPHPKPLFIFFILTLGSKHVRRVVLRRRQCGRGTHQPQVDFLGEECQNCPPGTFAPGEAAIECSDCYKPTCAKSIVYCDPWTGLFANYTYFDAFEAPSVFCNASESDVCFAGYACVVGVAQCSAEPTLHSLQLHFGNHASATKDVLTANSSVLLACPHLHGPAHGVPAACWDQLEPPRADGSRRERLLYSSLPTQHTAIVPSSIGGSCGGAEVPLRFQIHLVACRPGATECTDEELPCPSRVDER